jgi:hypothetical protein
LTDKTQIKAGDIVKCISHISLGSAYYGRLTRGGLYTVVRVDNNIVGGPLVDVTGDNSRNVNCFASRFVPHVSAESIRMVQPYGLRSPKLAPSLIDKQREERKAAEAAHKAKGVARAAAMKEPQFKKPLLFTEVSEADVYGAIAKMLQAKVYLGTLQVVGIDKTTEGFKLTLGVPA